MAAMFLVSAPGFELGWTLLGLGLGGLGNKGLGLELDNIVLHSNDAEAAAEGPGQGAGA